MAGKNTETKPKGRQALNSEATRRAIVDAARQLFALDGFFATKVNDVALAAGVAPATVYLVTGGKQGLLTTLIDALSTWPRLASMLEEIDQTEDPGEVLRLTAAGARETRERWGDVMQLALSTAPHDKAVARSLADSTAIYRAGLYRISRRLADLGALRCDVDRATDILWFYFGYSGYSVLHDDNGWSLEESEAWLVEQARSVLLGT